MEPIYLLIVVLGGLCGTVIPYYLKTRKNKIKFDWSYIYPLLFSTFFSGYVLIPEGEVTIKGAIGLFAAVYGITNGGNMINSKRKK